MLLNIIARLAHAFGRDAVLTEGRIWLASDGPRLDHMRHADGTLTLAVGQRELSIGRRS